MKVDKRFEGFYALRSIYGKRDKPFGFHRSHRNQLFHHLAVTD